MSIQTDRFVFPGIVLHCRTKVKLNILLDYTGWHRKSELIYICRVPWLGRGLIFLNASKTKRTARFFWFLKRSKGLIFDRVALLWGCKWVPFFLCHPVVKGVELSNLKMKQAPWSVFKMVVRILLIDLAKIENILVWVNKNDNDWS